MSFLAKLELDGETYNVLECKYSFNQRVDESGKPQGTVRGGLIHLKIESNGKTDFIRWMLSPSQTKNGKIIYYRRDSIGKLQDVVFEKAFCINFTESFNAIDQQPLQIEFEITAKKIAFTNIVFENSWKITN